MPASSRSASAAQANTPPMNRTPAAVHTDSNRSVSWASISFTVMRSPVQGTFGSPSGNGNLGSDPPLLCRNSTQSATSGVSSVSPEVYSRCRRQ